MNTGRRESVRNAFPVTGQVTVSTWKYENSRKKREEKVTLVCRHEHAEDGLSREDLPVRQSQGRVVLVDGLALQEEREREVEHDGAGNNSIKKE